MNPIKLPTGIRGDNQTPKQKEIMINAFYEQGEVPSITPRPGVDSLGNLYGQCRGEIEFQGEFYRVCSDRLYKVFFDGSGQVNEGLSINIGAIAGNNTCILIPSFTRLLILVQNEEDTITPGRGVAYVYDGATLTQITDNNFPPCRDAAFHEGFFVFIPTDGQPYFWNDLTVPATVYTDFADAEEQPDLNYSVIAYKDNLLIGGGETIERQQFSQSANTYVRVRGATKDHGVVTRFARYGENLVYIGKYKNGTMSFFAYGSDDPISSRDIDDILAKYSAEDLRDTLVESFAWRGQNMCVFHLPNESLLFYGDFAFIKSGISGNELGGWDAKHIASYQGRLICGDNASNRVGVLSDSFSDYGEDIEGLLRTFIRGTARDNFAINRIVVAATTGQSNEQKDVALSVSEDGVHGYSNEVWESLGRAGVYSNEISWQQIGRFDNFCGIQLRWVTDIIFPVDGVYFE